MFTGIYYNYAADNARWIRENTKVVCLGACRCQDGKRRVAYIASCGDNNADFLSRQEAQAWIDAQLQL